jgi:hypothetical protein
MMARRAIAGSRRVGWMCIAVAGHVKIRRFVGSIGIEVGMSSTFVRSGWRRGRERVLVSGYAVELLDR